MAKVIRTLEGAIWTVWMALGLRWGWRLAQRWPDVGPCNCHLWAYRQQQRQGGIIELLPSRYGPWLHARWVSPEPDGLTWEYNPDGEKRRRRFPPPLFDGLVQIVKRSSDPETRRATASPASAPRTYVEGQR